MSSEQLTEPELRAAIVGLTGTLPDLTIAGQQRLRALVEAARQSGDPELEAHAQYHLGRALIESGHYEEAASCLERTRSLHADSSRRIDLAGVALGDIALATLTGHAHLAVEQGRAAMADLDRMLSGDLSDDERRRATDLLAKIRSNLVMPLVSIGEFDEALRHSDAAIDYAERSTAASRAMSYSNRGHLLIEMGRPGMGLSWTERAAALFEECDSPARAARSHARSARAHALLGDFGMSLRRLLQARHDLDEIPGAADHHAIEIDLARVYTSIGRDTDARLLLEDALPAMTGRSTLNDRATGLQLLAELVIEQDADRARRLVREAHEILVSGGHRRDAALALLTLGELMPDLDPSDRALLGDSFAELETVGTLVDQLRWRVLALELDLVEGNDRLEAIATAESLAQGTFSPHLRWRLALQRGLDQVARGDLDGARAALHLATTILHDLRSNISDEWLRSRFFARRRQAIDTLGAVLLDLGLTDDLLELLDEAHGISLTEPAGEQRATEAGTELSMLYDEMLAADQRRLHSLQPRIRALQEELAFDGPPDTVSGRASPTPASTPKRPVVPVGGATLVVYGERDAEIYAIVREPGVAPRIVRNVTTVQRLRDRRTSLALMQRRVMTPALAPHRDTLVGLMSSTMHDLHDELVRPLALDAAGSGRIVIVPPASGVDVPYSALHDGSAHLVESSTITLSPGPSVAAAMIERHHRLDTARRSSSGPRTLAVGVGAEGVPASILEAAEIAQRTGGTLLSGADATVDRVLELLPEHDVLHLASHALSRTTDPWFSGLQLSDRWVTAAEITGWRLREQLIVLSGCDTGLQTTYEHPGANHSLELLGLPRAFMAAGASGVVATLSDIDDVDAVRFMGPLHEHLRDHPPDLAVRRTQQALLGNPDALPTWSTVAYIGGPSVDSGAGSSA